MRKVWFYSICIRCWLNTGRKGHKVILCVHLGFLQPPYGISSLVAKIIHPDCSSGNEKSKGSTKGSNQMSVSSQDFRGAYFPNIFLPPVAVGTPWHGAASLGSLPLWSWAHWYERQVTLEICALLSIHAHHSTACRVYTYNPPGTGEMAQWWKALKALSEAPGSVPSPHTAVYTCL